MAPQKPTLSTSFFASLLADNLLLHLPLLMHCNRQKLLKRNVFFFHPVTFNFKGNIFIEKSKVSISKEKIKG